MFLKVKVSSNFLRGLSESVDRTMKVASASATPSRLAISLKSNSRCRVHHLRYPSSQTSHPGTAWASAQSETTTALPTPTGPASMCGPPVQVSGIMK